MGSLAHSKQIFLARIEARAVLFAHGAADLVELLDGLEAAADQLVAAVEAQSRDAPLSKSFARACREADAEAAKQQIKRRAPPVNCRVAASTIAAAEYLVREGECKRDPGAARLRAWLDQHPAREALEIIKHIEKYRDRSCQT